MSLDWTLLSDHWSSLDDDKRKEQIIDAWREESLALLQQERAATTTGAGALAAALTVVAAGVAYGLAGTKSGHQLILLGIPPALALIGTYLEQRYGEGVVLRAARRDLERALSAVLGMPTHVYARCVAPQRYAAKRSPSAFLTLMTYATALIGITIFVWTFVPTTEHGHPLVAHAGTIKAAMIAFTALTFVPFFFAGVENQWLLHAAARDQVGLAILAGLECNAPAPDSSEPDPPAPKLAAHAPPVAGDGTAP